MLLALYRQGFLQHVSRLARRRSNRFDYLLAATAKSPDPLLEKGHGFLVAARQGKKNTLPNYNIARRPKPQDALANSNLLRKIGRVERKR
jgi:hypothetical protein